jgi:hypothetical protein
MKRKVKQYDLFHSDKRGDSKVEARLKEMMRAMETPDNIKKLDVALWEHFPKNKYEKPKLNFSKINAALDQYKLDNPEID